MYSFNSIHNYYIILALLTSVQQTRTATRDRLLENTDIVRLEMSVLGGPGLFVITDLRGTAMMFFSIVDLFLDSLYSDLLL